MKTAINPRLFTRSTRSFRLVSFIVSLLVCMPPLVFAAETKTLREERLDVIRYGIETEIATLIETLGNEKSTEFTDELVTLFNETRSVPVREGIIRLFILEKLDVLNGWTIELLKDPWDEKSTTVNLALSYAAALTLRDAAPSVRELLTNENTVFRSSAIAALGKIGSTTDAQFLFDMLDSDIEGDEKQRLIVRQEIIRSISLLKDPELRDRLVALAENEDENAIIRATAAEALAGIADSDTVSILSRVYESSDPVLRESAVAGAGKIPGDAAAALILDGLRDSYYKVRLRALDSAAEREMTEASALILYRAKTDPEDSVKVKAYEVLAKIGNAEAIDWLVSVVREDKAADRYRAKAAEYLSLSQKDIAWSVIPEVASKTLADDKKTWLRYELGKIIAKTDDQRYADLALAYLSHKDTLTRSLGLDMYAKQRYPSARTRVGEIASDPKQGALQKRAKSLESGNGEKKPDTAEVASPVKAGE